MSRTKVQTAWELLARREELGATWREVSADHGGMGHGSASRVLSDLHRTGNVVRLTERREGCRVYVLPAYAGDRDREPYAPPKPPASLEDAAVMAARVLGVVERWDLDGSGSPAMRGLAADLRRAVNRPDPDDAPTLGQP